MITRIKRLVWPVALCVVVKLTLAPASAAEPVYGVTYIEVAPTSVADAAAAMKATAVKSRQEPGNIGYLALARIGVTGQFAVLEVWADQQSMDASAAGAPAKEMMAALTPLVLAPIDRRPQTPVIVDLDRTKAALAEISPNCMIAVTHVDISPISKDQGLAETKTLDATSKGEAGNLAYDLVMQTNRPNHLSLVEVWKDQSSLQAHGAQASNVQFRRTILPLSGAPYDQRVYQVIN